MRTIRSVLISLALLTLLAVPAFAQEQEAAAQTFKLTLYGDVPEGETFRVLVAEEGSFDFPAVTFCGGPKPGTPPGPEDTECVGNGTTYTQTLRLFPAGTDIKFTFGREPAGEQNLEAFFKGTATIPTDQPISAYYSFGASGNNQQQEMVSKTFKLTLNGDVSEGEAFRVEYGEQGTRQGARESFTFCQPEEVSGAGPKVCEGNGRAYTTTVDFPVGTTITFVFRRVDPTSGGGEVFHSGTETLNSDMTNSAYYTFGANDQQTGDNDQQSGDDTQQLPEEMPNTGAGGMAGTGLLPALPLATLTFLAVAVCAALRGR